MIFPFVRKKISSLRLGTKSILAVILLISAISIALTTSFISRQRSSLTEELRKRAFSLASNMAFNCQYALLSRDIETLQNLLAGVKKESDILETFITDMDGIIVAHSDTLLIGTPGEPSSGLDSLIPQKWTQTSKKDVWKTITLVEIERKPAGSKETMLFSPPEKSDYSNGNGAAQFVREKLGFVVLEVSLKSMNEALAAGTWRAIMITLIMILGGALVTVFLVHTVAVPIYRLVDATRAVAEDNLDHTVPVTRSDEIGVLSSSFNHMIRQLKVSRERVEAWNRELEAKVAERTKELKEKHAELERAYEVLKSLDKAKDDFLSLVSHELRTPLSSVLLYSEMLLDGIADSEETKIEFLTTIVDNCKRLTRLINDVLDLSKIEAGRMPFKLEQLNIRELVSDTLTSIRPKIESKKIAFTFEGVAETPPLWGDRDKIIQVLTNIISNAVKFTPKGGQVTVWLEDSGKSGKLAISDTGNGISREDIPKVFDRFSQLESIEHHSEGTGLGMTISKSIIERLGGEIWIESELGRGTTVFFTLLKADQDFELEEELDRVEGNGALPDPGPES